MSDVVVGVDFGSSRIKAAAYALDGRLVAGAAVDTPVRHLPDGDDFLVAAMLDAAATAVVDLKCEPGSITAMGLASMGETSAVVTRDGVDDLAFPSWYDARGADVVVALEEQWGATTLRDATGRHTRTASTVAKLGHVVARGASLPNGDLVGICGAFAWGLTREVWQEASLATTSGVFDISARGYLEDVWESAGLGHVRLAPVREPSYGAPAMTGLARRLGLKAGAPVVIAGHDHPVAAVGAGVRIGEVADSMGTGEAVIAALTGDGPPERAALARSLEADPYLSYEIWPAGGELLAVWERMRPGLAMRTFLDNAQWDRATLDRLSPPPMARVDFADEDSLALEAGRRADIQYDAATWGALVDYYVALANTGVERIRAVSGARGAVVLTGGGLRSPRWRSAKAQFGARPAAVSLVTETVTRGCAAIAGVASGAWGAAHEMPGGTRLDLGEEAPARMELAARRLGF